MDRQVPLLGGFFLDLQSLVSHGQGAAASKGSCKVFLLILPLGEGGSREVALCSYNLPLSSSWCSFRIRISPVNASWWMLSTLSTGRGLSSLLSLGNSARKNRSGTSVFEAIGWWWLGCRCALARCCRGWRGVTRTAWHGGCRGGELSLGKL